MRYLARFSIYKRTRMDYQRSISQLTPEQACHLTKIPSCATGEPRFLVIGTIGEKHWSAVITYRNEKVRVISVRRSRGRRDRNL